MLTSVQTSAIAPNHGDLSKIVFRSVPFETTGIEPIHQGERLAEVRSDWGRVIRRHASDPVRAIAAPDTLVRIENAACLDDAILAVNIIRRQDQAADSGWYRWPEHVILRNDRGERFFTVSDFRDPDNKISLYREEFLGADTHEGFMGIGEYKVRTSGRKIHPNVEALVDSRAAVKFDEGSTGFVRSFRLPE